MMEKNGRTKPASRINTARLKMILSLLPKVPLLLRVVLLHVLRISEPSKYLDLQSDVIVAILRAMLGGSKPKPISRTQAMTLKDPGVQGRIWISTVAAQVPPETGIRDALLEAVAALDESGADVASLRVPDIVPIEAEWTGYRAAARKDAKPPTISEEEKYREMMKECKSSVTVLYFHGGAYYLCDPATHRPLTKKLAKLTRGRVYSVRYRLAPQHPFPAALLDALMSYFTLLYPPPGSIHEAVAPGDIVFGGDSAGGNLVFALLQTLLQLRRQNRKIAWFGEEREVPLPAAVTGNSPWCDLVQSMPSWATNEKWDYLPNSKLLDATTPPDDIWPAKPPRKHLYVDDAFMMHPLASIHLSSTWEESPPVYICCGWECLADEDKYLVSKLVKDGVTVVFEEYEAMPHVFASILTQIPESRRNLQGWTRFISAACENPRDIQSKFTLIKAKSLEESEVDVKNLSPFSDKEVFEMACKGAGKESPTPRVAAKL
ncbi:alpha/beta hydrolase fold-domain-containing protein [Xylariaceae sp. FL0016]|nr:alpha/beta hydrolase fold-domain-containing protein [Xylariaceae sp. FL0016]